MHDELHHDDDIRAPLLIRQRAGRNLSNDQWYFDAREFEYLKYAFIQSHMCYRMYILHFHWHDSKYLHQQRRQPSVRSLSSNISTSSMGKANRSFWLSAMEWINGRKDQVSKWNRFHQIGQNMITTITIKMVIASSIFMISTQTYGIKSKLRTSSMARHINVMNGQIRYTANLRQFITCELRQRFNEF